MDGFFYLELRESAVTITNMRGIYSDVMSDRAFAFVLSFARDLHIFARRQNLEEWDRTVAPVIHLGNATLGIVGLGGIGLAVAERSHTSDMRILGVDPAPKNVPDYVEKFWGPENLHERSIPKLGPIDSDKTNPRNLPRGFFLARTAAFVRVRNVI